MIVRKLRLQRGWSQDQLAKFSGLSIRTIQRIERGQGAGLESLKSLAAVFDVDFKELSEESDMGENRVELTLEERKAVEYVKDLKGFYSHLGTFVVTILFLFVFNLITSPSYIWTAWVIIGWGIGIVTHALNVFEVFNFLGADWERKQIEKRLGKKL